jgi:hypothetical protein
MKDINNNSELKLKQLKFKLKHAFSPNSDFYKNLCVYACGSLGRLELASNSDLDLFFILTNNKDCTNLDKYIFFAKLHKIHQDLGYKDPSKNGLYWDFISKEMLLDIGSRYEDFNNSFTARMLLILESKPIYNNRSYNYLLKSIINKYFIDYKDHSENFYPLFLMNDILRYWYTLTMNYEYRRDSCDDENKKNWKRLKLKYARLITCFSMLACLYKKGISPEYVITCVKMTPFQRLDMLCTHFSFISENVVKIKNEYEWFLNLKSESPEWWNYGDNKKEALIHADDFHKLVVHDLMKQLSLANPELQRKADFY